MNEIENLFLHTIKDIEHRLTETDPYEILLISGLLRKLFLDDNPLIDQVNRAYRIKLNFEIGESLSKPTNDPSLFFWSEQDGIDPDTAPPFIPRANVDRDRFLQTIVIIASGQNYSIREVVKLEANVMGGIHAGSPKNEKEAALKKIETSMFVGGYAPALRQLKAIARVVLKAIEPLRKAITGV